MSNIILMNLERIQSTQESKTSEENVKYLATYLNKDVAWIESKAFPYAGKFIKIDANNKNLFIRLLIE